MAYLVVGSLCPESRKLLHATFSPGYKLRWAKGTVKLVHYLDGDHH